MRALSLPAAWILAIFLWQLIPERLAPADALRSPCLALAGWLAKRPRVGRRPALIAALLLPGLAAGLLGAIHPAVCAVLTFPLLSAFSRIPAAAEAMQELKSSAYLHDLDAYDARVREESAGAAPVFVSLCFAPLLLCAAGMALHIGCAPGWSYAAALAIEGESRRVDRSIEAVRFAAEKIFRALMLVCSCVVGRSPFRVRGETLSERMLSAIGIDPEDTQTHAPMAGDIGQAIFLCCFCSALFCLALTGLLFYLR